MEAPVTTAAAPLPRTCRILYYGPPGSGKTANLEQIGSCVPAGYRVASPAAESGERLAFRVDGGELGSWVVAVEAVDPAGPGGEFPDRRSGFAYDGIVFVADSCADRLDLTLSSLESLKAFLGAAGLDVTSVPMVIQYNKQDAPGSLPIAQLESLLNPWDLPSFAGVASRGVGVRETLRAVLALALRQLDRVARGEAPERPEPAASPGEASAPAADGEAPAPPRASEAERACSGILTPPTLQIEVDQPETALFAGRRAPIVVPVRVPRSLLERCGTVRVVLEIELDERGTGLL